MPRSSYSNATVSDRSSNVTRYAPWGLLGVGIIAAFTVGHASVPALRDGMDQMTARLEDMRAKLQDALARSKSAEQGQQSAEREAERERQARARAEATAAARYTNLTDAQHRIAELEGQGAALRQAQWRIAALERDLAAALEKLPKPQKTTMVRLAGGEFKVPNGECYYCRAKLVIGEIKLGDNGLAMGPCPQCKEQIDLKTIVEMQHFDVMHAQRRRR